jgi:uncharacterized membrane protein YbhN (UPF0104 family)
MKIFLDHPYLLVVSLVMAVIAHVFYAISGYMLAQSIGTPMSMLHSVTFIPLLMLVTTIPISIGGWGVREAATVALLGLVGIGSEAALMISIQLGLAFMVLCLPAGVIWVLDRRRGKAAPVQHIKSEMS